MIMIIRIHFGPSFVKAVPAALPSVSSFPSAPFAAMFDLLSYIAMQTGRDSRLAIIAANGLTAAEIVTVADPT